VASGGVSEAELLKAKSQDRADLVQTYESVETTAGRLARLYVLGLEPSFDVVASSMRQQATVQQLAELAKVHLDLSKATIVVVGPKDKVVPQLAAVGLGSPELWGPEGTPLQAAARP
jgi:predicted Zn-dependent peptidase